MNTTNYKMNQTNEETMNKKPETWTQIDIDLAAKYLARTSTIDQLRDRQGLEERLGESLFRDYARRKKNGWDTSENERAADALTAMRKTTVQAIDIISFNQ